MKPNLHGRRWPSEQDHMIFQDGILRDAPEPQESERFELIKVLRAGTMPPKDVKGYPSMARHSSDSMLIQEWAGDAMYRGVMGGITSWSSSSFSGELLEDLEARYWEGPHATLNPTPSWELQGVLCVFRVDSLL